MPVEEQIANNQDSSLGFGNYNRAGQKLTIASRTVTKLSFLMKRLGAPTGDVTFTIRKVSDNSIIVSKVWGDAGDLPADFEWVEATFDTPELINEEVRILAEFDGDDADNHPRYRWQNYNVKADEVMTQHYLPTTTWYDRDTWDMAYKYTWGEPPPPVEGGGGGPASLVVAGII